MCLLLKVVCCFSLLNLFLACSILKSGQCGSSCVWNVGTLFLIHLGVDQPFSGVFVNRFLTVLTPRSTSPFDWGNLGLLAIVVCFLILTPCQSVRILRCQTEGRYPIAFALVSLGNMALSDLMTSLDLLSSP